MNMIENNLLYAVLNENQYNVLLKTNPNWFVNPVNKQVYKHMLIVYRDSGSVNSAKIKESINRDNYNDNIKKSMFERIDYVEDMITVVDSSVVEDLRENYINYKHIELSKFIQNESNTLEMKNDKIKEIHEKINSEIMDDKLIPLQKLINEYIENIDSGESDIFTKRSIKLNQQYLKVLYDDYVRPIVYIIAGAEGYNKTGLMLNLAFDFALSGKTGMIFSFEDTKEILRNKWLAIRTKFNFRNIMDNKLSESEIEDLKKQYKKVETNKIWVTDESYIIYKWVTEIERQMELRTYDYIMIDFIELFIYNGREEPKELKVIMKELLRISKKYYIPVICLSQINYEEKTNRDDGKTKEVIPHLSDLFGSSALRKIARHVLMIGGIRDSDERMLYIRKNTYGGLNEIKIVIDQESGFIQGLR